MLNHVTTKTNHIKTPNLWTWCNENLNGLKCTKVLLFDELPVYNCSWGSAGEYGQARVDNSQGLNDFTMFTALLDISRQTNSVLDQIIAATALQNWMNSKSRRTDLVHIFAPLVHLHSNRLTNFSQVNLSTWWKDVKGEDKRGLKLCTVKRFVKSIQLKNGWRKMLQESLRRSSLRPGQSSMKPCAPQHSAQLRALKVGWGDIFDEGAETTI